MARTTNYKTWHIILSWEWKIDMKQGHWGRDKMDAFFADDIFKCIFFKENVWISITISLKFVPKGPINNIPALVQIMAWRRPGDKPLSEPMLVGSLTHICVTRPQWVNSSPPSAAYMRQWIRSALVQIMAVGYLVPSHYLNQCWVITNSTLKKKLQWNLNRNITLFIHKKAFENGGCEMAAIMSWGRLV